MRYTNRPMPTMATETMEAMAKVMGKGSGSVLVVCVGVELDSWGCWIEGEGKAEGEGNSRVEISCGAKSG